MASFLICHHRKALSTTTSKNKMTIEIDILLASAALAGLGTCRVGYHEVEHVQLNGHISLIWRQNNLKLGSQESAMDAGNSCDKNLKMIF